MPRNRAVAIVLDHDKLLVIHRKNSRDYYTFPGGGVENGETNEQAAVREIKEETSIDCEVGPLAYELHYDNGDTHYYFWAKYIAGEPAIMPGTNEFEANALGFNTYTPEWVPVSELAHTTVFPLEVRDKLIQDMQNGFSSDPVIFDLEVPEQYRHPKSF